jgi:hypothetical protein
LLADGTVGVCHSDDTTKGIGGALGVAGLKQMRWMISLRYDTD